MGHKLDVALEPGETLIANGAVQFPSGSYKRMWGFRSFRDFQGRDISAQLPGWPPSKTPGEPPAKGSAKGRLLGGAWIASTAMAAIIEGLVSGGDAAVEDTDERDDYQVLSADPGTIAFGAPWQLDPGRNDAKPRVILHMTDRRLLFTDPASGALLWQIGRADVKAVDARGVHTRLTFADESWICVYPVNDKDSTVTDSDDDFRTVTVKGKPTRVAKTGSTSIKFVRRLKTFAPTPPVTSA
jgi:hypothetical protein